MSVDVDRSPIGLWDAYWSRTQHLAPASPLIPVVAELFGDRITSAKILEVGAGSGRDIVALAKIGATTYANDRSEIARGLIAERAAAEGVTIELNEDDLRSLRYADGTFDLIYSQGVLEHFTSIEPAFREQIRVAKSGGYIIVDVPQTFNPYTVYKQLMMLLKRWPAGWECQYSPADMRRFGKQHGLELVRLYGWGEHSKLTQPILGLLDRSPWLATCVGAVYRKP
ncbi:MAG: hypothetical protein NVSMB19_10930 [Vulcanimicrobiaceae bacterium]